MQMKQIVFDLACNRFVVARLPGPVWRGAVQTEKEGLAGPGRTGHALYVAHRRTRQHVGEIADLVVLLLADVQVMVALGRAVGEIVDPAGHNAEGLVVTRSRRLEGRWVAQVPFPDKRRGVARRAQQRRQSGDVRGQAQRGVALAPAVNGLIHATAQSILVAHGVMSAKRVGEHTGALA